MREIEILKYILFYVKTIMALSLYILTIQNPFSLSMIQGPITFKIRRGITKSLFMKLFVAQFTKKGEKVPWKNNVFSCIKASTKPKTGFTLNMLALKNEA